MSTLQTERGSSPSAESNPPEARVLVIVPTYNEADNIGGLLEALLELPLGPSILVVDDRSPDGTADRVREVQRRYGNRVDLLERDGRHGLATAYLDGFRRSLASYECLCEMDADLSHDPLDIPRLVAPVQAGEADLTIGSRYIGGVRVLNWSLRRLLLSYGAGIYTRLVTRLPVMDPTAGFKCFHRRVLQTIELDRVSSNGYSFQIEMNFRAWRHGFRIVEVPVVFTERSRGHSKMSGAHCLGGNLEGVGAAISSTARPPLREIMTDALQPEDRGPGERGFAMGPPRPLHLAAADRHPGGDGVRLPASVDAWLPGERGDDVRPAGARYRCRQRLHHLDDLPGIRR